MGDTCFTLHVGKAQAVIGKHRIKSMEAKIPALGMDLKVTFPFLTPSCQVSEHLIMTPLTNSGMICLGMN